MLSRVVRPGGQHIPYTPDDIFDTPGTFGRLPAALREYLRPQHGLSMGPSPRDTTTGAPPIRHVKQGEPSVALPLAVLLPNLRITCHIC